jgi:hypothetical protein
MPRVQISIELLSWKMFCWLLEDKVFFPLLFPYDPADDTEPPLSTSGGKKHKSDSLMSYSSK